MSHSFTYQRISFVNKSIIEIDEISKYRHTTNVGAFQLKNKGDVTYFQFKQSNERIISRVKKKVAEKIREKTSIGERLN